MVFYVISWKYLDLLTHNLKAAGSNPAPATKKTNGLAQPAGPFFLCLPSLLHSTELPRSNVPWWQLRG